MKTAVLAFTKKGALLAHQVQEHLGSVGYIPRRLTLEEWGFQPIDTHLSDFVGRLFGEYAGIIFISAVGLAVRVVAPHLKSKWQDPAVVVVDERGKFAVSLLSGHWGGGNLLTEEVAAILGATPVITTASDLWGVITPEMLARKFRFAVEERENLRRVTTLLLEGKKVVYVSEDEKVRKILQEVGETASTAPPEARGVVFVTDRLVEKPACPFLILRPRRLVLGVGMRRGMVFEVFFTLVEEFFHAQGAALSGVGEIASVEKKRNEPALQELAAYLSVPVRFFSLEELQKVAVLFPASPKVERALGVGSVARPSAFLASNRGEELGYFQGRGVTLALFRRTGGYVGQSGGYRSRK